METRQDVICNTIYHEDCFKTMKHMDNESVDMIFADPPFNIGKQYTGVSDNRSDYAEWCASWIAECFRILKGYGTFYLMTIDRHLEIKIPMMSKYGVFINLIKWRNVSSSHDKRRFWCSIQPILMYGKTDVYKFYTYAQTRTIDTRNMRWGGYSTEPKGQLLDYWDDIPFVYAGSISHPEAILEPGTNKKAHPCQMPVGLPSRAILFSTDEDAIVYDPFIGSGTTAIACIRSNRKYIGSEVSKEYFELANKRIKQELAQCRLYE